MHARIPQAIITLSITLALVSPLAAQDRPEVRFRITPLADNVFMLAGAGGNVVASIDDAGVLLVDTDYVQLAEQLTEAVKSLTDKPVRVIINTHWHFDHIGGNEHLVKAGALIVAHENVRTRMSAEQHISVIDRRTLPSPAAALPVITFADKLSLHWNGETIRVIHVADAHTDGDSLVHFPKANLLHVGDVWFNNMYPFIDVNAGGSIDGMIKAVDRALELADDKTTIIPGHGSPSNATELRAYRDMLVTTRDRVRALVNDGKSLDEVIAAKPTADLDKKWAQAFSPNAWVTLVYNSMTRK